ncbi:hypothetical protein EDD90_3317 [Streptomyces sp. Ag109_O5-1]|uniref:hypothetical protein n=1 Tax=Streptomyces sp. Ag109_O5-1 TaxID=1938851 RepID=UPI000F501EE5|nr:hypothetical protein [Streptomyces sp. Ag109_O5-1]RPE40281.1 hypothetical protein EDD90_3317 [Streptomyces sp. Ag109_O5-1]
MATYVVTGKSNGSPLVAVSIDSISQDSPVVEELAVVNAVRVFLEGVPGVQTVVAQRYEQVVTIV